MIIGVFLSAAHAESWETVIPAVEKRAAFYLAEANRLGYAKPRPWQGRALPTELIPLKSSSDDEGVIHALF